MENEVIYTGIFIKKMFTKLPNKISHPHLTLAYKPSPEMLETLKPYFGWCFTMTVIGYGNDGENEGYLISEIESKGRDISKVKEIFDHIENPHITLSVGENGKSVNTRFLKFDQIEPFKIKGTLGNYTTYSNKIGG